MTRIVKSSLPSYSECREIYTLYDKLRSNPIKAPGYLNCHLYSLNYNKDIDSVLLHFQYIFRGIHYN